MSDLVRFKLILYNNNSHKATFAAKIKLGDTPAKIFAAGFVSCSVRPSTMQAFGLGHCGCNRVTAEVAAANAQNQSAKSVPPGRG